MKVYQTQDIRNIALIGGNRTGKTTLAETMAFHGGVISRRGTVEDKNTLSDYREVELERQQSIQKMRKTTQKTVCYTKAMATQKPDDFRIVKRQHHPANAH